MSLSATPTVRCTLAPATVKVLYAELLDPLNKLRALLVSVGNGLPCGLNMRYRNLEAARCELLDIVIGLGKVIDTFPRQPTANDPLNEESE